MKSLSGRLELGDWLLKEEHIWMNLLESRQLIALDQESLTPSSEKEKKEGDDCGPRMLVLKRGNHGFGEWALQCMPY